MKHRREKVIGKFYGFTFDNKVLEFFLRENGLLYCKQIHKEKGIAKLIIEPNLIVYFDDGEWITYDTLKDIRSEITSNIGVYCISHKLIEYLTKNDIISYTSEMAQLYNLDPKYATFATGTNPSLDGTASYSKKLQKPQQSKRTDTDELIITL